MKILKLIFVILLFTTTVRAEVFKTDKELLAFTENVMEEIGKGQMKIGLSMMKPFMPTPDAEVDSLILQLESRRKLYVHTFGKSIGSELLGITTVGKSLIRIVYLEKSELRYTSWTFFFYRNDKGWILSGFLFQPNLEVPFLHEHDD